MHGVAAFDQQHLLTFHETPLYDNGLQIIGSSCWDDISFPQFPDLNRHFAQ